MRRGLRYRLLSGTVYIDVGGECLGEDCALIPLCLALSAVRRARGGGNGSGGAGWGKGRRWWGGGE